MKHLFLTSSVGKPGVAESVRAKIGGSAKLKTVFITTPVEIASEQEDLSWLETDRNALNQSGFVTFDYTITGKNLAQIQSDLQDIDSLYLSGGNSNYLLEQSQKSGFTQFVREFVESGKPYVSTSAGSIITGPQLPPYLWGDEKDTPNLKDYASYNLVNFTVIPHWGSKWFHDIYLSGRMDQIYSEELQPFILLNDHEYVEVVDDKFSTIDVRREK